MPRARTQQDVAEAGEAMSTKKDDGGPAFPSPETDRFNPAFGMTLRDYFASDAMAKMLPLDTDNGRVRDRSTLDRTAELAYAAADAMLRAREP